MAQEILERAKRHPDGFIEIEKRGVTVVQIGSMRIAIARQTVLRRDGDYRRPADR